MAKKNQLNHFNHKALATLMDQEGHSGTSLGEKLGMSASSVHIWLKGPGKPSVPTCKKLAKALHADPSELSRDFGDAPKANGSELNGVQKAVETAHSQCCRAMFDETVDEEPAVKLGKVIAHLNAARKLLGN